MIWGSISDRPLDTLISNEGLNIEVYSDKLKIWNRFIEIDLTEVEGLDPYKLYDAEYKFVDLIWENEPVNSTELTKLCRERLGWKKSTTYTVLRKLCERGILKNENAVVESLAKREEVQKYESEALIDRTFGGSLPTFLTAFLGEKKLTAAEAAELKRIIEEASE